MDMTEQLGMTKKPQKKPRRAARTPKAPEKASLRVSAGMIVWRARPSKNSDLRTSR